MNTPRLPIGQRWGHDASYYHFPRCTPTAHRHIPFARTRRERMRQQLRRQFRLFLDALFGTLLLLGLIALLTFAPVWSRWLP